MSRQQSGLTWRDLKRFSVLDSHSEEAGVERLLRAETGEWKTLLAPNDLTWDKTSTTVLTLKGLSDLQNDFPDLIAPLLNVIWEEAGFWKVLKDQLGRLCNVREVDASELQATLDTLAKLLPQEKFRELESTISELGRKFGAKSTERGEAMKEQKKPLKSNCRFPPRQILHVPSNQTLKRNPILPEDPGHESVEGLLECHRSLLSEDFLFPLRRGIMEIGLKEEDNNDDLFSYGKVQINTRDIRIFAGRMCFEVQLDSRQFSFEHLDWESNPRLRPGSLLIIALREGQIQDQEDYILAVVDIKRENSEMAKGKFTLNLVDTRDVERIQRSPDGPFHLYESKVYFEAYRYVIDELARKKKVPFGSLLTNPKPGAIQPPEYMRKKMLDSELKMDVSCLKEVGRRPRTTAIASGEELYRKLVAETESKVLPSSGPLCTFKDILDPKKKGELSSSLLNASQLSAFCSSLSQEVSLIQGPPGTGKTFIGKLLLTFLHDNQHLWRPTEKGGQDSGPIVIICYTNHALDSLLEGMLPVSRKIVRVGGRSKSDALENHNLATLRYSLKTCQLRSGELYKLEKSIAWKSQSLRDSIEKTLRSNSGSPTEELAELGKLSRQIEDIQLLESARLLRQADFVGFTTTGAAKNHALLERLKPRIVLLEEAGQILEGHSLASLPASCQHLIMIGDHQQLRPVTASYHLARDYHLDISLFERLINHKVPFTTLQEQHRMRPTIASVMSRVYYPGLSNHCSVNKFPPVLGVDKNLFFLDHSMAEDNVEGTKSKVNLSEAHFLLSLATYLIRVGHLPQDITILTTYVGQYLVLRRLLQSDPKFCSLSGVRVCVVDNFQGEENKIILLSLVRSGTGSIGFLSHASRSCVALSRAQWGFFVVGNMTDLTSKSDTWRQVAKVLRNQGSLGGTLRLVCPHHKETFADVTVNSMSDFDPGHCRRKCEEVLSCGHICPQPCHLKDRRHREEFKCGQKCSRKCSENHPCQKACSVACYPCEFTSVEAFDSCGHEAEVSCASLRKPAKCIKVVEKYLDCKHHKKAECHQWSDNCESKCQEKMACGHPCGLVCHFAEEKEKHNSKCTELCTEKCPANVHSCVKLCWQPCDKKCNINVTKKLNCGHLESSMPCHVSVAEFECPEKCGKGLDCEHECKNFCHECKNGCDPCSVRIKKRSLKCGHEVKNVKCSEAEKFICKQKCARKEALDCGHSCQKTCSEICDCAKGCSKSDVAPKESIKTETVATSSPLTCSSVMNCGHPCESASCSSSTIQVHPPCKKSCGRSLVCGHSCQALCGQPCPPCQKKKCLLSLCSHTPCKAVCEDPCVTACKLKCGLSCEHVKCEKKCSSLTGHVSCKEQCKLELPCGHPCLGVCGEKCPEKSCSGCHGADDKQRFYSLPCGHDLTFGAAEALFSPPSNAIGLPSCSVCQAPVAYSHRFRKNLADCKVRVTLVADAFFALKSSLNRTKKDLEEAEKMRAPSSLSSSITKQLSRALADKKNPPILSTVIDFETKLTILDHLEEENKGDEDWARDIAQALEKAEFVNRDFLKQILDLLSENGIGLAEEDLARIRSIDFARNWQKCTECSKEHVFYAGFTRKCPQKGK